MKDPKKESNPPKNTKAEKFELASRYVNNYIPVVPGHGLKSGKCTCGDEKCRTPAAHSREDKPATTVAEVEGYWDIYPKAKVGLPAGARNIIAVKLETSGAGNEYEPWARRPAAWGEWEKTQGLPRTVMYHSANEEFLLFRLSQDNVPFGALKIADGITVFGIGEFVELPQSFSSNDKLTFCRTCKPYEVDVAHMPDWLYRMINYTLLRDGKDAGFDVTLIPHDLIEQPDISLDEERVKLIAESLQVTGIRTPVYVRPTKGYQFALLSDRHEFEAVKLHHPEQALCAILTLDNTDAELWQLAQLLNQPKLPVLDWAEAIMRWVELVNLKGAQGARPPGGHQPHDKGFNRAGRVIGVSRRDIERASKIASICAAAKAEIRRLNFNVKRDLVAIGATPEDLQLAMLYERTRDRKSEAADATITLRGSTPEGQPEPPLEVDHEASASFSDELEEPAPDTTMAAEAVIASPAITADPGDAPRSDLLQDIKGLELEWEQHCLPYWLKLSDAVRRYFVRETLGYSVAAADSVDQPDHDQQAQTAEGDAGG
jgi:Bifunctional DNA primase/polymerase, N-terminal